MPLVREGMGYVPALSYLWAAKSTRIEVPKLRNGMDMRTVETPADHSNLDVRALPQGNMPVIWDRGGERRIVPTAIIINARATNQAGVTLMTAGLIESIPEMWWQIPWEACRPLGKPLPVKVNLRHDPRPGVVE